MIKAIFFTRFHPGKGPVVVHQVPDGSIIPSSVPPHPSLIIHPTLFDFSLVSEYIIPRQEFCDRLVTVCVNHYRIIGYPVCITDELKYDRNEFIFNFAVVMDEREESAAWEMVVRKLAVLMRSLEEQSGFLSKEEAENEDGQSLPRGIHGSMSKTKARRIYALCEMIMEDLNNYSECMIPIDDSNTLNLKLFPPRPPPPHVHGWHVPLAIVRLSTLQTSNWDLTVSQIIPYINGTNSVHVISQLADTDFALTRKAIQHLLYYHCILLLDIFQFSAIYAPTPEIFVFLTDESMQEECRRYVTTPDEGQGAYVRPHRQTTHSPSQSPERASFSPPTPPSPPPRVSSIPQTARPTTADLSSTTAPTSATHAEPPTLDTLRTLYTALKQGLTVKHWCVENISHLARVDVRRFITFGVIKGFLYRIHKYAVAEPVPTPPHRTSKTRLLRKDHGEEKTRKHDRLVGKGGREEEKEREQDAFRLAAMTSGWATPAEGQSGITAGLRSLSLRQGGETASLGDGGKGGETRECAESLGAKSGGSPKKNERDLLPLARYLDGMHCLDEICSELGMSEREVLGKLRGYGEIYVIHR